LKHSQRHGTIQTLCMALRRLRHQQGMPMAALQL
jgi:hypothetical protein